jgi:uncharacterized protein YecE (DUF72 family)
MARGDIRIGISGWRYAPWRGVFYPKKLRQKDELAYAANTFRTVEINGTFYSLQSPKLFAGWAAETPDDFVFAVKGPRFITHMKRLKDVAAPLANFMANGLLELGPKLGPILWQFPPDFRFNAEKIKSFFEMLPRDTTAAARLARRHDARVKGRTSFTVRAAQPMRHAMEIRHDSFRDPAFVRLLRKYRVALVCADTVEWPRLTDLTSDFAYCRLHGSEVLYASGYDAPALKQWASWVRAWARGAEARGGERILRTPAPKRAKRDVYVYFDNDAKVRAPFDAQRLEEMIAKKG